MSKEKPTPGSRANPPFMSPKGGIRPHNRFSIQAKRSEVLFVDCMAEHLTPDFSAKGPTDFSAKGAAPCQPRATPQENAPQDGKGLKARPISRADDGTGLQPSGILRLRDLGRCPRLVWNRPLALKNEKVGNGNSLSEQLNTAGD